MKSVAVVMGVHNRCVMTKEFLYSLRQQTFEDFVTIVVDDGSTDGTSEMIKEWFPEVVLLKGDGSLWWSASTNWAIKYAIENYDVQYVCTVNDDTILHENFLLGLYNAAIRQDNVIVGAFSYDILNKEALLYNGSVVNWLTGSINTVNALDQRCSNGNLIGLTYYIGRGVMIPVTVFKEVGYYDSVRFPQSWADNELVFRARRKGYHIVSTQDAKQFIYSDESKHLKLKADKSWTNYIRYLFKQQGGGNVIAYSKYIIRSYPWYGIPSSLTTGVIKRVVGYWLSNIK